ncbi:RHS repeat-associated core domain-containing protein [Pseudidiomarina terrestris]|uniref:RHS repeat-associated core domain-containing protein n=1 Tax=Pseudidiomarina terrestris TaxID=2820060 RepID=UPI00265A9288|nr:RHS repeat-associated core domain-containing protein [Pseudidiomarina sp. 1APR75-33.1]
MAKTVSGSSTYSYYSQDGQLLGTYADGDYTDYYYLGREMVARYSDSTQSDAPGYTGHVEDDDLGLVYMQQRYYDANIGRFYSNDPVDAMEAIRRGQPVHGFNRYAYVNNNPYKYTDPNGEWLQAIYGAIAGAAGGYVSSGEGFVNTAVGMVSGALAGGAVGLANPFASHTAGIIAGGMVASASGQVTASVTTTVLDKGISNVTASDIKEGIKVDAVTTVAGGLGAGGGGLVAKGIANSTMKPIIGTTPISQAGAPHAAGMTAGAVAEGVIIGTSEKIAPQVVEKVKDIIE